MTAIQPSATEPPAAAAPPPPANELEYRLRRLAVAFDGLDVDADGFVDEDVLMALQVARMPFNWSEQENAQLLRKMRSAGGSPSGKSGTSGGGGGARKGEFQRYFENDFPQDRTSFDHQISIALAVAREARWHTGTRSLSPESAAETEVLSVDKADLEVALEQALEELRIVSMELAAIRQEQQPVTTTSAAASAELDALRSEASELRHLKEEAERMQEQAQDELVELEKELTTSEEARAALEASKLTMLEEHRVSLEDAQEETQSKSEQRKRAQKKDDLNMLRSPSPDRASEALRQELRETSAKLASAIKEVERLKHQLSGAEVRPQAGDDLGMMRALNKAEKECQAMQAERDEAQVNSAKAAGLADELEAELVKERQQQDKIVDEVPPPAPPAPVGPHQL